MPVLRDEEALFSRDDEDRLIVREKATRERFQDAVKIVIDGNEINVPRCVPATDFLGNVIKEADGLPKPRNSTIYDAARQLVAEGKWSDEDLATRIPVLCHREHLNPIAVCRMCSVHVSKKRKRDGKVMPSPKLVPACQHEVQPDMIVTTWCGGVAGEPSEHFAAEVAGPVRMLTELLLADHHHPDPERDGRTVNELEGVSSRLGVDGPRPAIRRAAGRNEGTPRARPIPLEQIDDADRDFPYSARTILVDHDRCILCDRCARSCSDVKPFKVIGHTGKGYGTRISFDIDEVMNESSCVQCGECMTSCPTGALVLKRRVAPRAFEDAPPIPTDPSTPLPEGYGFLTAEDMVAVSLPYTDPNGARRTFRPFATIPFSYLKWNEGAVRLRRVEPGDVLCTEGEYGSTAFLLRSGSFEVRRAKEPGMVGRFFRSKKVAYDVVGRVDSSALILGELAVLSNRPRTATIVAAAAGEVYEVTRNLLDMAQRSPSARDVLGAIYARNAVRSCLRNGKLFAGLTDAERKAVFEVLDAPGGAELRRVDSGETIVGEGAEAKDFYIVRQGFVKVTKQAGGTERVLARLGEDDHFGEVALLSDHPAVAPLLPRGTDVRRRTASVIALDPVEVVRIPGEIFRKLCDDSPTLRDHLAAEVAEMLKKSKAGKRAVPDPAADAAANAVGDYLSQGLFQGQKLLVLDLECCTRCDECTRACADAHGDGVSRLLRDGLRFGDFLVATSCRSCHKPYCMEGCPVDAIHRSKTSLEVLIDDHCIGCGLCETNCPYGSIQMVAKVEGAAEKGLTAAVARRAVNCDLCHDLVPANADPFCVAACPHEAAFRWDGETLLKEATGR
jgi:Fe-S-cluster-containing hydrogenase component 2/CRP-like cAMP-binding protein